jgi:hypothetical protein
MFLIDAGFSSTKGFSFPLLSINKITVRVLHWRICNCYETSQ